MTPFFLFDRNRAANARGKKAMRANVIYQKDVHLGYGGFRAPVAPQPIWCPCRETWDPVSKHRAYVQDRPGQGTLQSKRESLEKDYE